MSSSLCSEATASAMEAEVLMLSESSGGCGAVSSGGAEDLAFSLDNLALLVEDIKEGFAATMQQLVKIEGQDAELRTRLDSAEIETKQKMAVLQSAVQHMREQFASVVARVESLELHHRRLEGQVDLLDRAAQAERIKLEAAAPGAAAATADGSVAVCCHHPPVYDATSTRATCQTPMTPYSCPTPLSPDSGRPGTCTPSCYHSNEFHGSADLVVVDGPDSNKTGTLYRSGSATVVTIVAATPAVTPASSSATNPQAAATRRLAPHSRSGVSGGGAVGRVAITTSSSSSCEAIAEKSLHMSRALADGFRAHVDSSGEDCELGNLVVKASGDQLFNCQRRDTGTEGQKNGGAVLSFPGDSDAETVPPSPVRQVDLHENALQQDRRRRVCQEIVETERKYCYCLWTIIDLIAESLKSATFLTMKDLCLIFPKCLPRLYELHSIFLGMLEERLRDEEASIAAIDGMAAASKPAGSGTFSAAVLGFLDANNCELFDLYRDYANDFGTAVQTIRKYQQHSARFRKLQHSLQHHPNCEGLDLTAFLLTPVQRMPRYLLLMRQLSVHTPAGHPDESQLNCVLERLHCLLDELNYSIQTALRQAAEQQQQQQQQRWKRSRSLPRPTDSVIVGAASVHAQSVVPSTSASSAALAAADGDCSGLHGSSSRGGGSGVGNSRHFLARGSSGSPAALLTRRAAGVSAAATSSRCRSMPPQQQQQPPHQPPLHSYQQQQQQKQQQHCHVHNASAPLRTESPKMGPRSRLISRQLRNVDRCMSTGDILRSSPSPAPSGASPAASATASPLIVNEERVQQRLARRGSPPKSTIKESFRRIFQSKRKSSIAKLESQSTCGSSTFEDENGDPCTDV